MSESHHTTGEICSRGSWASSYGTKDLDLPSTIKLPGMNSHNNFISFLAVVQFYEIDFASLPWQQARGRLGAGGTSEIWQSIYDRRTAFVFKRMKSAITHSDDQENGFNSLVSEVTILSHPLIRYHQNIVKLEGISWEISSKSHQIWPVLILEKAQLGDLKSFMNSEQGRMTTVRDRLELCTDIASAMIALHSNCMSHGDIKPENVLLFQNEGGELYAKLADFGYAGWAINNKEDALIKPPRSRPWDPPEYHHRGFTILGARKLDVYSFGMLCLWFIFFDRSLDINPVPNGAKVTRPWPFHDSKLLDSMKHDNTLGEYAGDLVRSVVDLPSKQRRNLEQFFLSALAHDPAERIMDFEELASLLGHNWQPGPFTSDTKKIDIDHSSIEFGIAENFYPLMRAPVRVRSHIFKCLNDQAKSGLSENQILNAAFQIAFCFKTGFGTPSNDDLAHIWLKRAQRCAQDLDEAVKVAKRTINRVGFRNGVLQSLVGELNYGEQSYGIGIDRRDNYWTMLAAECKRELRDMELTFGKHNQCVLGLKLKQASILDAAEKSKEAESLRVGLLQDLRHDPGPLQRPVLATSVDVYKELEAARWRFYEGPRKPLLQLKKLDMGEFTPLINIITCLNYSIPETFDLLLGLSFNYARQDRFQEATGILLHLTQTKMETWGESDPTTLDLATKLANSYERLGEFAEAERIFSHISDIYTWVLGENHSNTLQNKALLAHVYREQGRLDKAETLILQVLEAQRKALGKDDVRTYDSMGLLASIYSFQGRYNASETLRRQVVSFYEDSFGPDDLDTLLQMSELSAVLANQERWPEVEKITTQVLERRKEILGPEHTQTLTSMQHLAVVHAKQGLLREAESGILYVIKCKNAIYGANTLHCIDEIQTLATLFQMQGRLKEQEALLRNLIGIIRDCLGHEHPKRLRATEALAWNQLEQSRPGEAERLYLGTIHLGRKARGESHPDQLISESRFALIHLEQSRSQEAEKIMLHVLEHIDAALGVNHPETMVARVRLARILAEQRRWRESDPIFLQAIEQRRKVLGNEHELTLGAMRFYARSLWSQGRWREAVPGFFHSSRGVCTVRNFMSRRRQWDFASGLGVSLVVAISAIAYGRSKRSFPAGFACCQRVR